MTRQIVWEQQVGVDQHPFAETGTNQVQERLRANSAKAHRSDLTRVPSARASKAGGALTIEDRGRVEERQRDLVAPLGLIDDQQSTGASVRKPPDADLLTNLGDRLTGNEGPGLERFHLPLDYLDFWETNHQDETSLEDLLIDLIALPRLEARAQHAQEIDSGRFEQPRQLEHIRRLLADQAVWLGLGREARGDKLGLDRRRLFLLRRFERLGDQGNLAPTAGELANLARKSQSINLASVPAREKDVPTRRVRRRHSHPERSKLIARCRAGADTPAPSREYGISKCALLHLLWKEGVIMRNQPITPRDAERAACLYESGLSITEIVDQIG